MSVLLSLLVYPTIAKKGLIFDAIKGLFGTTRTISILEEENDNFGAFCRTKPHETCKENTLLTSNNF